MRQHCRRLRSGNEPRSLEFFKLCPRLLEGGGSDGVRCPAPGVCERCRLHRSLASRRRNEPYARWIAGQDREADTRSGEWEWGVRSGTPPPPLPTPTPVTHPNRSLSLAPNLLLIVIASGRPRRYTSWLAWDHGSRRSTCSRFTIVER